MHFSKLRTEAPTMLPITILTQPSRSLLSQNHLNQPGFQAKEPFANIYLLELLLGHTKNLVS